MGCLLQSTPSTTRHPPLPNPRSPTLPRPTLPTTDSPAAATEPAAAAADPDQLTFNDLGLSDAVLKALKDVGYETPSAIQAATIPPLLAGRDVIGLAQTGTGKTAAFALPILSRLDVSQKHPAGAGARTHPRARAAGVRGLREVRVPSARRPSAARLRRSGLRHPALRPAPRRARRRRHARPHHGSPRQGHPRSVRAQVPRAR